jgi:hypothetical protein
MTNRPTRRRNGSSLVEVPVTLWVFIFLMMLPLIDLMGMTYRCVLAYFGVRDACYQAALQNSFTDAKNTANSVLGADAAAWTGIGYANTNVYAVEIDPGNSNAEASSAANTPWSGTISSSRVYLIRVSTDASCEPFLNLSVANWASVPGITGPITLKCTYQVAAENPNGLTN